MYTPSMLLFHIALCALLFLGGIACGYAFARHRNTSIPNGDLLALSSQASAAHARAQRLEEENADLHARAHQDQNVLHALAPLARQLDQLGANVAQIDKRTNSAHLLLHEQIEASMRVHEELSREARSLRSALVSTSARGTWGEVELHRLVEAAGMLAHVDFSEQVSTGKMSESGSSSRPDLVVHLPGGGKIAVDSKVPMNALLQAEALDPSLPDLEDRRSKLLNAHAKALRSHIATLTKRNYPNDFPGSPRLTVLFLPAESLLSQALTTDPTLLEDAARSSIALVTPSSFLALLRSAAAVWANNQITTEAHNVLRMGRTLIERLNIVARHLDGLGGSLRTAVKNYNKTVISLESRLLATVRSFESFDLTVETACEINPEDSHVRTFSSAQLSEISSESNHIAEE